MHFGHFTSRTRISVISLLKFNFHSPLTHGTFSCNFSNTVAEIQSLSSFCQITLNSTYNNNKLHFLQFLAKRLFTLSIIINVVNSVPYRPVRPEYTVPASNPIHLTLLFRTGKNTGRTALVPAVPTNFGQYRPVRPVLVGTKKSFFFFLKFCNF